MKPKKDNMLCTYIYTIPGIMSFYRTIVVGNNESIPKGITTPGTKAHSQ